MANQQLVDYINGQTVAGVSEADVRKVLKDAGWPDAEIDAGFSGAKGAVVAQPAVSSVVSVAASVQSAAKPVEPAKAEPKKDSINFDFMTNPGGMASMPSESAKDTKMKESKPLAMMSPDVASSGGKPSMLPWIVAGVAVLVMLGVGVYFYMQNSSLSGQVDTLTASSVALTDQLASLKSSSASLDELNAARADALEATNELSLFIIPSTASGTAAATPFALRGTIDTSKSQYTLTMAKGIVLYVKNSKDLKVDIALKPLIGASAELAGTHVPGTYELTVDTVNGALLLAPVVATSTPPAGGPVSTSTKPAATSTPPRLLPQ